MLETFPLSRFDERTGDPYHARVKEMALLDLYDKPEPVAIAMAKAVPFFKDNL